MKRKSRHRPWIFFLVQTCLSTGSCLVKAPPKRSLESLWALKNGTHELSPPPIFAARVPLYVFTLLRFAVDPWRAPVIPSLSRHFRTLRTFVHDLRTSRFPMSFLITTSALTWPLRAALFIYSFIYSISIFCELFNYVTHVLCSKCLSVCFVNNIYIYKHRFYHIWNWKSH